MKAESKRALERVSFFSHLGIKAELSLTSAERVEAKILDLTSQSVSLEICDKTVDWIEAGQKISAMEIYNGKSLLSSIERLSLIRMEVERRILVLGFHTIEEQPKERGSARLKIVDLFIPTLMCQDPIDFRSTLTFQAVDVSPKGFCLSTSLSNKHLFPGISLKKAQLILPGIGVYPMEALVKWIKKEGNKLIAGVELIHADKALLTAIAQFCLFGAVHEDHDNPIAVLRKAHLPFRTLGKSTRLSLCSTKSEYQDVLKIRHIAYLAANKLKSGSSEEDMADSFDSQSLILLGKIKSKVVATARIVLCRNPNERFNFEDLFPHSIQNDAIRKSSCEIGKLCILPECQNSDLLTGIFSYITEVCARQKVENIYIYTTSKLEPLYRRLGAKPISDKIPHPVIPKETLQLMLMTVEGLTTGRGYDILTWNLIFKDMADSLISLGLIESRSLSAKGSLAWKQVRESLAKKRKKKKKN